MTAAYYDSRPAVFEAVGNGSYLYRWGIEEVTVEREPSSEEDTTTAATRWRCFEVVVWATVTREKITEAVIAALWPADVEAKLINDYNAAVLGLLGPEYIDRYREFIEERQAAKERVAGDWEGWDF